MQSLALAQELGEEQQVELLDALCRRFHVKAAAIAHRDGGLDDHDGIRVDTEDKVDDILDAVCVEEILYRVVVCRRGYHHKVSVFVCRQRRRA